MNLTPLNPTKFAEPSPWRFCTAPCMDWTDRHCRHFWRQLTHRSRLYTEMVTTGALLHGDVDRHLNYGSPDHQESFEELCDFVGIVAEGGCNVFIVHARKAWLEGLSPKQNREIPPLNYAWVYALKKQFPHLTIVLNGGIQSLEECEEHLIEVDGVMLGRAAYQTPWLLSSVDSRLFGAKDPATSREAVIAELSEYVDIYLKNGGRLNQVTQRQSKESVLE